MSDNSKNISTFKVFKKDNAKETIDLNEMLQDEITFSSDVLKMFLEDNTKALILLEKKGVGIKVLENGVTPAAIAEFVFDVMKNNITLRQFILSRLAEDCVDIERCVDDSHVLH